MAELWGPTKLGFVKFIGKTLCLTAFAFCVSTAFAAKILPLPFVFALPSRLRHRLCPVFALPSRLRHCLCPVFPLPSRLRYRLCLLCLHCLRG